MLTTKDLDEFRLLLGQINRMAQEDLVALWRGLEGLPVDDAWRILAQTVPDVVEVYRASAAEASSVFYGDTQKVRFSSGDISKASQLNREQVVESMRYAMFADGVTSPLLILSGVVQKHVINGAREYGLSGFEDTGVGWFRAARAGACEFCRMLATRSVGKYGAAYSSAEAASVVGRGKRQRRTGATQTGGEFHTNCMCLPVRADMFTPPEYYSRWLDEYNQASELVGTSDLKKLMWAMRNPEKALAIKG